MLFDELIKNVLMIEIQNWGQCHISVFNDNFFKKFQWNGNFVLLQMGILELKIQSNI